MKNKLFFSLLMMLATCFTMPANAQLKVLSGGRVGIGTNDVSWYKCHIQGDAYVMPLFLSTSTGNWGYASRVQADFPQVKCYAGGIGGTDNFFALANGEIWARKFFIFSDDNVKKNVETIDEPLDKISQLRGVYFDYKSASELDLDLGVDFEGSDEGRQMGVIAQETEGVVPEVVQTNDKGLKAVQYGNMVGLLIEGIKAQQNQITEQQAQIESQQNQITTLQTQLTQLQNTVASMQQALSQCCNYDPPPAEAMKQTPGPDKTVPDAQSLKSLLYQNAPNPFNTNTSISYETAPGAKNISIYIYDMQGKQIRSYKNLPGGKNAITVSANELQAGIYLYSLLINGQEVDTKRMVLVD